MCILMYFGTFNAILRLVEVDFYQPSPSLGSFICIICIC